jgi:predicted amidohydrolase
MSQLLRLLATLQLCLLTACSSSSCSGPPTRSRPPDRPTAADEVLVAAVQTPSTMGDVAGNAARMERLAAAAAAKGAEVVVFPEAAVTGYLSQDLKVNWHVNGMPLDASFKGRSPRSVALTRDGPVLRRFSALARSLGLYLVLPYVERDPRSGLYYNSATLLGPKGGTLLHYRKINPWPYPEDAWATPGDQLAVASTPLGRVGLLICYDVHTIPQRLAAAGAEVLLYPIAWVDDPGSDWFSKQLPAIARRHKVAIIGANWSVDSARRGRGWHGAGQSRIIDRSGKVVAAARGDVGEEILYARLRRGEVLASRRR